LLLRREPNSRVRTAPPAPPARKAWAMGEDNASMVKCRRFCVVTVVFGMARGAVVQGVAGGAESECGQGGGASMRALGRLEERSRYCRYGE
jgi:hypothetical protein